MRLPSILRTSVGTALEYCYKTEGIIYFHWPFCKQLCTFCSFNKYVRSDKKFGSDFDDILSAALLKETATIVKQTNIREINSIYFGGGTPSLAPLSTISSLIGCVKDLTKVKKRAEITVECNPSSSSMFYLLEEYAKCGVNRVSVGLQLLLYILC